MDINASNQWFANKQGKVTYSMANRNGPSSYDCSSAEYRALIASGVFPSSIAIGNTDSLFGDLERHGFTQLQPNAAGNFDTQAGDVFIWGRRGASGGAAGHTGQFADADNIWNCNAGYNGIHLDNYDWLHAINGSPEQTFYRYTGNAAPTGNQVDQIVEPGSWIRFDGTYTVDDIQQIGNIWQVRTNQLCQQDFTWDDNGIPAIALTEVDNEGFASTDQELAIGSLYKIPGKFSVLDVGETNGRWLAQVGAGSMTFWVDIETATEISTGDTGTPTPSLRQIPAISTPTPAPVVPPTAQEPTPVTEVEPPTTPITVTTGPVTPPKGDSMLSSLAPYNKFLIALLGAIVTTAVTYFGDNQYVIIAVTLLTALGVYRTPNVSKS